MFSSESYDNTRRSGRRSRDYGDDRDHDLGSSSRDSSFYRKGRSSSRDERGSYDRSDDRSSGWRGGLFGRNADDDEGHRMCRMIVPEIRSRGKKASKSEICRALPRSDKAACKFFVRNFRSDIREMLRDRASIDQICDEIDYAKTSPLRGDDQSDTRKIGNIRGGENARRSRGGDPTRDSVSVPDEEGERALNNTPRSRKPMGSSSAGLNKGGRAIPIISSAAQKEVGWDTVDPHEEGHPAASSGRAGAKGVGLNFRGRSGY